jgi:hypothetical protein
MALVWIVDFTTLAAQDTTISHDTHIFGGKYTESLQDSFTDI